MSLTEDPPQAPQAPVTADADRCANCGGGLEPDQEWCLECGTARTIVHRPPDPRIGVAIIAAVLLAVLVGLAIVLLNLSTNANRQLGATSSAPRSVSRPAAPPAPAALAGWPVGLSGWTVVLGRSRSPTKAFALARRLAASGLPVGVLDSTQHPHLQAGYHVVFSGRYPDKAGALTAAAGLRGRGQPQALAREVARPGGL